MSINNYLLIIIAVIFIKSCHFKNVTRDDVLYYKNEWLVKMSAEFEVAKLIAEKENFEILEEIKYLPGLFHFRYLHHLEELEHENEEITQKLEGYNQISNAEQVLVRKIERKWFICPKMEQAPEAVRNTFVVNDPFYEKMWYLHDCRHPGDLRPDISINVVKVWNKHKVKGANIKVLIVDDGIDTEHLELKDNYDPNLGYNLVDNNEDPNPHNQAFSHGTACAAVIAGKANNNICGVGIAPSATVGAVRLFSANQATNEMMGKAFSFMLDKIDISNNSWGPTDDGKTLGIATNFEKDAISKGINEGRQKKGILYVVPAGNGRLEGDMCGYDWLVNLQYSIAVSAAGYDGNTATYSERCSGVMVTAYSTKQFYDSSYGLVSIAGAECTDVFSGTSAAVPVVSGVLALVLEANPELTWREIQHLIVYTSNIYAIKDSPDWVQNDAGFWVSHDFGFGLINPDGMIELAKNFRLQRVPPLASCVTPFDLPTGNDRFFTSFQPAVFTINTDACKGLTAEVNYVEHVQLVTTVTYPRRGDIKIDLISPGGTIAHLIEPRYRDNSVLGLVDTVIDSVQTWGEFPRGEWKVKVSSEFGSYIRFGTVEKLVLIIHGTRDRPPHYYTPRKYDLPDTVKLRGEL